MNYLAHSYLSSSDGQIVGNMIADYIRNSDRDKLPSEIQRGIIIHREIDTFTDQHPVIHRAKKAFRPLVRLYSGAFVDVTMDYYLANDIRIHTESEWLEHTRHVYKTLWNYGDILPGRFRLMLPKMEADDWLFNYRYEWGIKYSLQNVLNKAKYLEKDIPVFQAFMEEKDFLKECYELFFPDLKNHIENLKF